MVLLGNLLSTRILVTAGFELSACWQFDGAVLTCDNPLPKIPGVYAFAEGGIVQYVGVASINFGRRIGLYVKPGTSQFTNIRLNAVLKARLSGHDTPVEIYTASPPDFEWHGLPVNGTLGLEFGLISTYSLPWNVKGIRK
jgi:hypothetical protein